MRLKERIPIFLQKVNFDKLQERWEIDISQELRDIILSDVRKYWENHPDQRFGQMLINLNHIPDNFKAWNDEEDHILDSQDVPKREYLLWGNNFDKDMNKLPDTIWKPIMELGTEHIESILDGGWVRTPEYIKVFKEELELRK